MDPIVVGIDGSSASRAALRWALAEARLRSAPLRVVHSWTPPYGSAAIGLDPTIEPMMGPAYDPELLETVRTGAESILGTELAELSAESQGLEIEPVLFEGPPAEALVAQAENAQLLVVGSRGHGGLTGLLLGSVSQHVAQHAPCPLVIVPDR
jgi:nucleotide-binding universal stress UspA family protein